MGARGNNNENGNYSSMKIILCLFLSLSFASCRRFTSEQNIREWSDGCFVVTDVWDNEKYCNPTLVQQWACPCKQATDSIRKKHLELSDSLANLLNK